MTDHYIPMHWTPEQAAAVFEFLDEIRDEILAHYQVQIMEYMKEDRCYDPQYEEFEDRDIPF
jgi:hypothetical protein